MWHLLEEFRITKKNHYTTALDISFHQSDVLQFKELVDLDQEGVREIKVE